MRGGHRRRNKGAWVTRIERLAICLRHSFLCVYCLKDLRDAPSNEVTMDHLVPYGQGGLTEATNLVLACRACNTSRGSMDWGDFATPEATNRIVAAITRPLNIGLARSLLSGHEEHSRQPTHRQRNKGRRA